MIDFSLSPELEKLREQVKTFVDDVIKPTETRRRIAEALANAPAARGAHGNIPL